MKMRSKSNKKPKPWPMYDKLCVHFPCIPRSFARSLILYIPSICCNPLQNIMFAHCFEWLKSIFHWVFKSFVCTMDKRHMRLHFFSPVHCHPAFWFCHLSFRCGFFLRSCSSLPKCFAFVRRNKLDSSIHRIVKRVFTSSAVFIIPSSLISLKSLVKFPQISYCLRFTFRPFFPIDLHCFRHWARARSHAVSRAQTNWQLYILC